MCGIIGYVGEKPVADVLLKGLKRLEYRGYDSSGIAFFEGSAIQVKKAAGKIVEVEKTLHEGDASHGPATRGGIGHTRWATHGKPNSTNAHPHQVGDIVLVHNGIIENYKEIQELVRQKGLEPVSETDSEMFGFLVKWEMELGTPFVEAVRKSFLKVTGSCSVVAMHNDHPGLIVAVRNGSPLVAAHDKDLGTIVASDAQPILDYTNRVYFLENGDMITCTNDKLEFVDLYTGAKIERAASQLDWSADRLSKNGYAHYMLKEIHEQSRTIRDTLNTHLDISNRSPFEFAENPGIGMLERTDRLSIVACGTSWHASLMGKYWLERWTNLSVEAELASEFRYRRPTLRKGQVVMGVSQSGETADTLAVLQDVKKRGLPTLAVTNVRASTIAREVAAPFYTSAGPEIGVASTKAFTAQMLMLLMMAGRLGRDQAVDAETLEEIQRTYKQLFELSHLLAGQLEATSPTAKATVEAAQAALGSKGFFFMGRGYSYPLALEGALKLKEIAYVHAEGYAAGELKHGPIAMMEPGMTVVCIAPRDQWYEKTVSNLQEVKARGAKVIAIGHAGDHQLPGMADAFIPLPVTEGSLAEPLLPFLISPILQLFSYEIAVAKGTDVDQPRNLAKSVTVE